MGGGEKQDNGGGKGRRRGESTAQTSKQAKELETQNIFFYSSLSSPDCMSFPLKTFFLSAKKKFLIRGEILLSIKLLSSSPKPFVFGWPLLAPAAGCCHEETFNFFVCLPCLCTHFVIGRGKFLEIACAKSSNPFPNNWAMEYKY